MGNRETSIQNRILVELSRAGAVVFRQNTGSAWVGEVLSNWRGRVQLGNARPMRVGLCKGSPDIVGWLPVTITREMVGTKIARFVAVEAKTATGRPTKEQRAFIAAVIGAGGIAGIARSDSDALRLLEGTACKINS